MIGRHDLVLAADVGAHVRPAPVLRPPVEVIQIDDMHVPTFPELRGDTMNHQHQRDLDRYFAISALCLCLLSRICIAQQEIPAHTEDGTALPEAPQAQVPPENSLQQTNLPLLSSSLSGQVLDVSGAALSGAHILLHGTSKQLDRVLTTGPGGEFFFARLAPGSYSIVVSAKGFRALTLPEMTLTAEQNLALPSIVLAVAAESTEITVYPTEVIAAQQIKVQEQQRLIGIVPDFYVSYVSNAAPMTSKQKFSLAARESFDWTSFLGFSETAAIQQATNSFAGYGQGAAGYGKRWAVQFADGQSSGLLSHAVFPSLFHQDPRYFYQGTGTKKARFIHAASSAVIARSDKGRLMPNYSYVLARICSGALSNAYYPHADRGLNLVFTSAAIGIADRAGQALFQEFIAKHIVTHPIFKKRP